MRRIRAPKAERHESGHRNLLVAVVLICSVGVGTQFLVAKRNGRATAATDSVSNQEDGNAHLRNQTLPVSTTRTPRQLSDEQYRNQLLKLQQEHLAERQTGRSQRFLPSTVHTPRPALSPEEHRAHWVKDLKTLQKARANHPNHHPRSLGAGIEQRLRNMLGDVPRRVLDAR